MKRWKTESAKRVNCSQTPIKLSAVLQYGETTAGTNLHPHLKLCVNHRIARGVFSWSLKVCSEQMIGPFGETDGLEIGW